MIIDTASAQSENKAKFNILSARTISGSGNIARRA